MGGEYMQNYKSVIHELLSSCGIAVNGSNPWDIRIHDERTYPRVFRDKSLGLGESYMDGWWDCAQIDELIHRLLIKRADRNLRDGLRLLVPAIQLFLLNCQTINRSKQVAERHYDLGNELFFTFLDSYNQYSCAYFNGTGDLEDAQKNKMELICKKLNLNKNDHVLDIGFGWGGLARYMAENYGCTVTGVNISQEQTRFAHEWCKSLPVHVLRRDYREMQGVFDKIVSVGMFEHVGRKNYRIFMETAHRCLKDGGIFLLHTIGVNESARDTDPWMHKYIFPNGELPSVAQVTRAAEGLFVLEDFHNLGPHYEKTLLAWNRRFQSGWPQLEGKYGNRFKRMWEYYLLSCAGAFRARYMQIWQFVFTKCFTPQPVCRY